MEGYALYMYCYQPQELFQTWLFSKDSDPPQLNWQNRIIFKAGNLSTMILIIEFWNSMNILQELCNRIRTFFCNLTDPYPCFFILCDNQYSGIVVRLNYSLQYICILSNHYYSPSNDLTTGGHFYIHKPSSHKQKRPFLDNSVSILRLRRLTQSWVTLQSVTLQSVTLQSVTPQSVMLQRVMLQSVTLQSVTLQSVTLQSVTLQSVMLQRVGKPLSLSGVSMDFLYLFLRNS